MKTKNLQNLTVKHFDFLQEEYGLKYDVSTYSYVKKDLKIEVQHVSGKLNVFLISNEKKRLLVDAIGELLNKEFGYPEHFSSFVLSMGDVDSRLAYDAKLLKSYAKDIL